MKGPAGYGRYDDDPKTVGCPWAKSDMTPCLARDGHLALSSGQGRVCVGCGNKPTFLIGDLAKEYPPAREMIHVSGMDPVMDADTFQRLAHEATDPMVGMTLAQLPESQREKLYTELAEAERMIAELRHEIVTAGERNEPRTMIAARKDIIDIQGALIRAQALITTETKQET